MPAALLSALLVVRLVDETVSFLPFGALEPIRADLDLTYTQAGILLGLYPGVALVGTPIGALADRVSRRLLASVGAFGYAAGFVLFALGGSFWTAFAAVCVMGLAGDAMVRGVEVALVDVAGDQLESAVARTTLLATIGDLAGPVLLAVALGTGLGWRAAFLAAAAGLAAYGCWLAMVPVPPPARDADGDDDGGGLLAVVRDRRVVRAGLLGIALDVFDEPFFGFAIAYLITSRGNPPVVATLAAGASVVGGLLASAIAARVKPGTLGMRHGAWMLAAGAASMIAAPHPIVAAVGATLLGAGLTLAWIVLQADVLTLRPGQAGATSSVVSAVSQVAIVVPVVVGAIADRHGILPAMSVYVAVAAAFVIATWTERARRDSV